MIFIQDAAGNGLPGIRVRVQWGDGEDTFFTGLKGTDPGYADYEVQAGKSYSVSVVDGASQMALELNADALDSATPLPGTAYKVDIARALIRRALAGIGEPTR